MQLTAKQLAQDLQNQIDSLESDYIQEIGITEEEYLDKLSYLECQLENVNIIDEIIEDYEDIDISGISQL